ncbi:hypothetical protein I4F81_011189 [Pyropia yezoensis]|uniref:Uncharacterized protein n=1 Tax=Pyropia yezoensis TaxID=2788 RepID=A0ACC3CFD4_PYRYE|nr:hypothetical protein I4F81_011189 [Neopyropia yezoensis]
MCDGEALMTYVGRAKTLRAELAGAGHPIGEDTAVLHVLAGLPSAYKTVTSVLMTAGVSFPWDQLLTALLPLEVEQKETAHKGGGESSIAYGAYHPVGSGGGGRGDSRGPTSAGAKQLLYWYCSKPGHRRHECRKLAADKKRRSGGGGGHGQCPDDVSSGAVAFTATVKDARPPMAGQADASSQSGSRTNSSHIWIIDSGASHHMTNNSFQLVNYISTDGLRVTLANGETAAAMGKGSLRVSPQPGIPVTLEEVLYVPSLADNLLSVRAVTPHGGSVDFIGDTCAVRTSARMAMMGTPNSRNQYEVGMQETSAATVAFGQASSEVARLWHRRYCHLSATNLRIRRRFDN